MPDFARARAKMVASQLMPDHITDHAVLAAMGRVPREKFLPAGLADLAYLDRMHKLPCKNAERFLPPAIAFARLIQLANIGPKDFVLDVGCGTGYSAAVLADLANAVIAIDDQAPLVEFAAAALADLDIGNTAVLEADLTVGVPEEAPFDVIVVEGTIATLPANLTGQLREGGRLVCAWQDNGRTYARLCVRNGDNLGCRAEFDLNLPPLAAFAVPAVFAL